MKRRILPPESYLTASDSMPAASLRVSCKITSVIQPFRFRFLLLSRFLGSRRSTPFLSGLAGPVSKPFRRWSHRSYRRTAAKNKPDPSGQAR